MRFIWVLTVLLCGFTSFAQSGKLITVKLESGCSGDLFVPKGYSPNFSIPLVLNLGPAVHIKKVGDSLPKAFVLQSISDHPTKNCIKPLLDSLERKYFFDEKRVFIVSGYGGLDKTWEVLLNNEGLVSGAVFRNPSIESAAAESAMLELFDKPVEVISDGAKGVRKTEEFVEMLTFHETKWKLNRDSTLYWYSPSVFNRLDSIAEQIKVENRISERDQAEKFDFRIYPIRNKVGGKLTIQALNPSLIDADVHLLDLDKKPLHAEKIKFTPSGGQFVIPDVASGFYYVQIVYGNLFYVKRIYVD